jgi:hypothetical protein
MPNTPEPVAEPKASRVRVWQAAERILKSGRRPTVEGVRELLGGGSPNSVTAYLNDWYRELGTRLAAADPPIAGLPADAIALLGELWRLAAKSRDGVTDGAAREEATERLRAAEHDALAAQRKVLETLNQELQRHRASAEKALAETRAMLARREAALDEERARAAALEQTLAQTTLELEVSRERLRLAAARAPAAPRRRPVRKHAKRPAKAARAATKRARMTAGARREASTVRGTKHAARSSRGVSRKRT